MRVYHLLHRLIVLIAIGITPVAALPQPATNGLKVAIDAAWQRSPQARALEAKRDEAQASKEVAGSWIANSPSIGLGQRSDRWTDQDGIRENEISVSVPIWLPGQKTAREMLAQNSAEDLEAQIVQARLTLAGEVRERLWAVVIAQEALAETQDHLHHLEGLTDEVMRRVKVGDLARTDSLLAQQEMLAAKNLVAAALAKEREAITRYTVLTGQTDIPQAEPESLAISVQDTHPRILSTRSAVAKAQASLHAVNAIRRDPTTVSLLIRQERYPFTSDTNRSIGFALQIPLDTRIRNRPLETAAHTQIATANAEAILAETALQADIKLANQQLTAAQSALVTATERAALTREHTQLIEKAFRLGERGLAEVLRSQALSHEAGVAERQQRAAVGLAHARLNQASGIIP